MKQRGDKNSHKKLKTITIPPSDRNLMRALEPRILLDAAGVETALRCR